MEDFYNRLDVPILDVGNRIGSTDYIDYIKLDEVTNSVMKGRDIFRRKFIVVKFKVDNECYLQTFFQRYTNGSMWMGCGHATINLIDTCGGMDKDQVSFINNVINNGSSVMKHDFRPTFSLFNNKLITIF